MSVPGQRQTSGREYSMSALPSTADKHQGDGCVSFVSAEVPLRSITSSARRNSVCGVPSNPSRPLTALHAEWSLGELRFFAPSAFRRRQKWPFCAVQSALRLMTMLPFRVYMASAMFAEVRPENRRGRDRARELSVYKFGNGLKRAVLPNTLISLNSTGDCP
jgi:hypothetical protein